MKWKLYWIGLISALFGVLFWKNTHNYKDKAWHWNACKSLIEGVLLIVSAAFAPAFLVIYGGMWITRKIERPAIRAGIGFGVSILMMLMLSSFLELVVLVGVFAIDILAADFIGFWNERRSRRKEMVA